MSRPAYSLVLHGGAGNLENLTPEMHRRYRAAIAIVLEMGGGMLAAGAPALDAVTECAAMLEDDPLFNAGMGSVLNADGRAEMDACLMDGATLKAGAVTGVHHVRNPIRLARVVMERTAHVLIGAEGAERLAAEHGVELADEDYFRTPLRTRQLDEARKTGRIVLDHQLTGGKYGTVGAVARDRDGNLAAATSTGGMANKHPGRIGDSPIPGAGCWAENATCAVSCTGVGEDFLRTALAKTVSCLMEYKGMCGPDAARAAIAELRTKVDGTGGIIVVDRFGNTAAEYAAHGMIRGWVTEGASPVTRILQEEDDASS